MGVLESGAGAIFVETQISGKGYCKKRATPTIYCARWIGCRCAQHGCFRTQLSPGLKQEKDNPAASRMSNAAYSTDIRSASPDGATWELELVSTTREPVRLWFNGLDSVPETYDVLLVDDVANIVHDVRASPSYNLADIGSRSARALKLVIGKASFAAEQVKTLHDVPSTVELLPAFPNPFASSTTIRYGLPEPSYVSMRLFSIAGQLIKELENGQRSKGRHSIVLDAASVEGGLANGVYLLELRAGGHRRTALITCIQ